MKFLNIPMNGHTTARPRRRAVWQWGVALVVIAAVWVVARLVTTATPVLAFVPKDSTLAILLQPTQKQWDTLLAGFGDVSIFPGVGLAEIRSYAQGSILLMSPGSNPTVVFEGSLTSKDEAALAAYGVPFEKPRRGVVVLGDTKDLTPVKHPASMFVRLLPRYAGSVVFQGEGASLLVSKNEVALMDRGSVDAPKRQSLPTAVFESVFFGPNYMIGIPDFLEDLYLSISGSESLGAIFETFSETGGVHIDETGTALETTGASLTLATLKNLLDLEETLKNIEVNSSELPDGSRYRELRTGKASSGETIRERDWEMVRSEDPSGSAIAGVQGEKAALSTSKDLFVELVHGDSPKNNGCGRNPVLVAKLPEFLSLIEKNSTEFSTDWLFSNTKFVNASVHISPFASFLRFCY